MEKSPLSPRSMKKQQNLTKDTTTQQQQQQPQRQQQQRSSWSTFILKGGLIGSIIVVFGNIAMIPSVWTTASMTISKEDIILMKTNNNNDQKQLQNNDQYEILQTKYDTLQKHHEELEIKYNQLEKSRLSNNHQNNNNDTKTTTKTTAATNNNNGKKKKKKTMITGESTTNTTTATKSSVVVAKIYKVNLWDDSTHFKRREELFNKEGWSNHPQTTLVNSPNDADIIVWVTTRARTELEIPPTNYSNVIILDYADGCLIHQALNKIPKNNLIGYFKRSYVRRSNGIFVDYCTKDKSILPLAYSGAKALINRNIVNTTTGNDDYKQRQILITNNLRTQYNHNQNRAKIVNWTKQYVLNNKMKESQYKITGFVGRGQSGSNWDNTFLQHLSNCKIIITSNPNNWEGDFRLWEALLSGALVMVDEMKILDLLPYPYINKKHLIFYDSTNQTQFNELLNYYIKNENEAAQIARAGFLHTIQYHMPSNRVSYILDNVQIVN